MTVVAVVPDLMDRSRFPSSVEFIVEAQLDSATLARLGAAMVIVDLSRLSSLDPLALIDVPRWGFAPHVENDLADQARAIGCTVLARSVFFRRLNDIVSGSATM